ncbi:MAG: hypothetical protein EA412_03915 [Chitinophagaceae bacterium]|nr:MAG: hypothetical protein EA412_03915 [Chitinophagaceae bacterium]
MNLRNICLLMFSVFLFTACNKDKDEPMLNFIFVFDENQQRLDNLGQPSPIPDGHAAQTPQIETMAAHYIELTPTMFTQIGEGEVVYQSHDTEKGGSLAIEFNKLNFAGNNEVFFSIPLKDVKNGNYDYIRVSLAYQKFDVALSAMNINLTGTLASFLGYNNYLEEIKIKDEKMNVYGNRSQGFWAFETTFSVDSGSAPVTTVPNPLAATSPIPPGSCLVTGIFAETLSISGNETNDIDVYVSLSVNNSFEWVDNNDNGIWEPLEGEFVVDMGIRGMKPYFIKR